MIDLQHLRLITSGARSPQRVSETRIKAKTDRRPIEATAPADNLPAGTYFGYLNRIIDRDSFPTTNYIFEAAEPQSTRGRVSVIDDQIQKDMVYDTFWEAGACRIIVDDGSRINGIARAAHGVGQEIASFHCPGDLLPDGIYAGRLLCVMYVKGDPVPKYLFEPLKGKTACIQTSSIDKACTDLLYQAFKVSAGHRIVVKIERSVVSALAFGPPGPVDDSDVTLDEIPLAPTGDYDSYSRLTSLIYYAGSHTLDFCIRTRSDERYKLRAYIDDSKKQHLDAYFAFLWHGQTAFSVDKDHGMWAISYSMPGDRSVAPTIQCPTTLKGRLRGRLSVLINRYGWDGTHFVITGGDNEAGCIRFADHDVRHARLIYRAFTLSNGVEINLNDNYWAKEFGLIIQGGGSSWLRQGADLSAGTYRGSFTGITSIEGDETKLFFISESLKEPGMGWVTLHAKNYIREAIALDAAFASRTVAIDVDGKNKISRIAYVIM